MLFVSIVLLYSFIFVVWKISFIVSDIIMLFIIIVIISMIIDITASSKLCIQCIGIIYMLF